MNVMNVMGVRSCCYSKRCLRPQLNGFGECKLGFAKIREKVWRLRIFLLPLPNGFKCGTYRLNRLHIS